MILYIVLTYIQTNHERSSMRPLVVLELSPAFRFSSQLLLLSLALLRAVAADSASAGAHFGRCLFLPHFITPSDNEPCISSDAQHRVPAFTAAHSQLSGSQCIIVLNSAALEARHPQLPRGAITSSTGRGGLLTRCSNQEPVLGSTADWNNFESSPHRHCRCFCSCYRLSAGRAEAAHSEATHTDHQIWNRLPPTPSEVLVHSHRGARGGSHLVALPAPARRMTSVSPPTEMCRAGLLLLVS